MAEGELVRAWDEATSESDCRPISETFVRGTETLLALDILHDTGQVERIVTTAEHPFYRPDLGRFVRAAELVAGDALLSSSGAWLKLGSATWVQQSAIVYNLTVDEFHTYFVGQAGTLVHNKAKRSDVSEKYKYHERIRARGLEDPVGHNFPYSFDKDILSSKPVVSTNKRGQVTELYQLEGELNGRKGVYEIGVNPDTNVIFHRTWRSGGIAE